ncbi:Bacteriophage P22, NinX [uncultured Caudovirales phage]|uniref:Bacteriophage P22, NinX n=1 Tax=uncultured Caudovirales phage TaxID=2100421 RepID=A0A6J5NGX3_9CAUD|nr:Bacteriophage P22, NinX [uncultured Caudovirales phage]
MTKIRTSDLIGPAIEWAVAVAEGHHVVVLTVAEQEVRWFGGVEPEKLERERAAFDAYIRDTLKPEIRLLSDDGHKRHPTHSEAAMLYAQGIPKFMCSTSWAQGGPIIEREGIAIHPSPTWTARYGLTTLAHHGGHRGHFQSIGPTPLVAAMRCYVRAKLGDEVDVPDELLT